MGSDGASIAMPDVPSGKAVGVEGGLFVDEPATGNFLLLSAGELWELNPDGAGSWTWQTGTRTPPGDVGVPGTVGVTCSSIPDYGVVAYITVPNFSSGTFYLYKHSSGSALEEKRANTEAAALSVHPIPASVSGAVRISSGNPMAWYMVYDVRGRVVADLGANTVWAPNGIQTGVYVVEARIGSLRMSRKVILE
jgi:hypothetical protein